jgi:acetyl esterase/lipase
MGIDASRIALLGRSAGGHLALLAAYTLNDPAIRGAISFYGPTDLRWGWEHPANKLVIDSRATLNRFLGGTPADSAATYETASPVNYTLQAVPTLLIHGARDELVSVHHSEMLAEKLQRRGMPFVFVELPWATHGCDYFLRGPCGQISTWAVERFLLNVFGASK